jgi:ribosomal protein S18 acetylase RimI-like enzyme
MSLQFRLAGPADHACLEAMVIDAFEPVTWSRQIDLRYGPPNGMDWRERWRHRMRNVFATETILLGEAGGEIVACATGVLDAAGIGFIDILCVRCGRQGRGYGRAMLRAMLDYFRKQGATHCHLECLSDNDAGNRLYESEGFEEVARSIRWWIQL